MSPQGDYQESRRMRLRHFLSLQEEHFPGCMVMTTSRFTIMIKSGSNPYHYPDLDRSPHCFLLLHASLHVAAYGIFLLFINQEGSTHKAAFSVGDSVLEMSEEKGPDDG